MLLLYNILSCLILGRTHAKESLEMDLSSFALRLYEGEILIHVQVAAKVQEVDVRSKSNVMAFLSIAIQRDAPRGLIPSPKATLLSFYYRPFVISTTMALEDGGSGVARMTASKWQPRLSYIRFGLTGDPGRVVVFLSFSSISLSLPLCSFSFSLFASLLFLYLFFFTFLRKVVRYCYVSRAFPPQTVFPLSGFFAFISPGHESCRTNRCNP